MLAKAILVHGEIGYKFFLLLPSEDRNQGHQLIDHQSTGHTPVGHEIKWRCCQGRCQRYSDIIFFRVLLIFIKSLVIFLSFYQLFLIVSCTCSYFSISFNLVLANLIHFVALFSFVFFCFFVFVTFDTSCICQIGYETVEEDL